MIDLTENKDTRIALGYTIDILSRSPYDPLPSSPLAQSLMGAFHSALQSATIESENVLQPIHPVCEPWKDVFWSEVATVARTLLAEQDLNDQEFTMREWLDLRVLTISGNGFFCWFISHFVFLICRCLSPFRRKATAIAYTLNLLEIFSVLFLS